MLARKPRPRQIEKGGLELTGDALALLRAVPFATLAAYLVGTVPFVVAFLFFWSDMSRSAFAAGRCLSSALGLALLFAWMKAWQAVFARGLMDAVSGHGETSWTWRRAARLTAVQLSAQPYGLLAIPAALLAAVPFYAVYGFYQNLTVLGDGASGDVRRVSRDAFAQALLWPRQNHVILWLLCPWVLATGLLVAFGGVHAAAAIAPASVSAEMDWVWSLLSMAVVFLLLVPLCPFGCAVAGNLALALAALPMLAHALFGIETRFVMGGWHSFANTTFVMTVYALAYLCLDPVIKAAFVLRCFHGRSLRTGEDLTAEMKALAEGGGPDANDA